MTTDTNIKLAAIAMVKNETKRIHVTVNSVTPDIFSALIVYDTGSTDDTIEIIRKLAKVPVHIKEGKWDNYGISYTNMLKWGDKCAKKYNYDWFVQLDANDEFVGNKPILPENNENVVAYLIERKLKYSCNDECSMIWNYKLIKAFSGCKFIGVTHDYLNIPEGKIVGGRINDFYIFQDRTNDDKIKGMMKFHTDRILLEKEHLRNPTDTRTLFYLAQTYETIGEKELAYEHYEKRSKSIGGFEEERWLSYVHCGDLSRHLNKDWSISLNWYMTAMEHTERAEPLLAIANGFITRKKPALAYPFVKWACYLEYPIHAILSVEKKCYDYWRWHLLGITAYYSTDPDRIKIGENACVNAILEGTNKELDERNLAWYLTKA